MNDKLSLQVTGDCALCACAARAAAGSMKELGATVEEISVAIGLDVTDVQRHFRECVPPLDADPRSASDAELDALIRHATELYFAATIQNALVASASALSVRLRALTEKASREAFRSQRDGLLDGVSPLDPCNTWPIALQRFVGAYVDGVLERIPAASSRNNDEGEQ